MRGADYLGDEYRFDAEYGLIQEVCLNFCQTVNRNMTWHLMHVGECILLTFNTLVLDVRIICGYFFNLFTYVLNVCFKFWISRLTKKGFYTYFKYFENNNCFKIYKITFL